MFTSREFYVGVDLGQKHDFTAIAIVERHAGAPAHFLTPWDVAPTRYHLRFLERVPLGTPYPLIVSRIGLVTHAPEIAGHCTLVVDASGVGAPIVDMLREAELDCQIVAVTITGGDRQHRDRGSYTVPKRDLISTLELMLENDELRIAGALPERRRLVEEFMSLKSKTRPSGHEVFGASGRAHDDLVMAVALACWRARTPSIGHSNEGRLV